MATALPSQKSFSTLENTAAGIAFFAMKVFSNGFEQSYSISVLEMTHKSFTRRSTGYWTYHDDRQGSFEIKPVSNGFEITVIRDCETVEVLNVLAFVLEGNGEEILTGGNDRFLSGLERHIAVAEEI